MKDKYNIIDIKVNIMITLFESLCGIIVVSPAIIIDIFFNNVLLEVITFIAMYFIVNMFVQQYLIEKSIEIEEKWRKEEKDV